jgi:hypothetical protein
MKTFDADAIMGRTTPLVHDHARDREFGEDPNRAHIRPPSIVEKYEQ